jgi:hypothetical protein
MAAWADMGVDVDGQPHCRRQCIDTLERLGVSFQNLNAIAASRSDLPHDDVHLEDSLHVSFGNGRAPTCKRHS